MDTNVRTLQAAQAGPIRVEVRFARGRLVASSDPGIVRAAVSVSGEADVAVSDTPEGMQVTVGKGKPVGRSRPGSVRNVINAGSVGSAVQLGDFDGVLNISGDDITMSGRSITSAPLVEETHGEVQIEVRVPEGSQVVAVTAHGETDAEGVRIQTRRPD